MEGRPPILRKSPLQIVVVELRFAEAVLLPEDLKTIRRGLSEHYPDSGSEHGVGIELTPEGALRQQQATQRQVYRTVDGSYQVGLSSTALVLEARGAKYEGFEHLLDRWLTALDVVAPVAEITNQLRLGLRYVNQLQVEDTANGLDALAGRLNPALLSPRGAGGFDFVVSSSFEELRLRHEHGKATLRHGLQLTPEGTSPPGIYLLDIDSYDDGLMPFDRERQADELKLFNSQIWGLFRWSLTDDEYERMQPEERP